MCLYVSVPVTIENGSMCDMTASLKAPSLFSFLPLAVMVPVRLLPSACDQKSHAVRLTTMCSQSSCGGVIKSNLCSRTHRTPIGIMGGLGGDERLCSTREVKAKEPSSQVEPEAKVEKKQKLEKARAASQG